MPLDGYEAQYRQPPRAPIPGPSPMSPPGMGGANMGSLFANLAPMGLSALGLPALLSFAPALFSHFFGGDPQKEFQRKIAALSGAQNVGATTNQFYQQALGSPAYTQAQNTIAQGANQTASRLGANLGASGLGTSGTGAILSSLMPSLVAGQQGQLRTGAYQSAQQQAQDAIQQQIKALYGTYGQPSRTSQLAGTGFEALMPYLQQFLASRNPGFATSGGR